MSDSPPRKVDDYAALWTKLIGPICICMLGAFGFGYELFVGHDANFGTISAGLAAAGAGFSADVVRRRVTQ